MRRKCWCGRIVKGWGNWQRHEAAHAHDHQLGVLEDEMALTEKRERQLDTALGLDPDSTLRASGMGEFDCG